MRALYFESGQNFEVNDEIVVEGERLHHLKVVRVRPSEEILLLLGRGKTALSEVVKIDKKAITLKITEIKHVNKETQIDLYVGLTKKDAFEELLKLATELGVDHIVPLETKFSQPLTSQLKRQDKIIQGAMEQSNNAYAPVVDELSTFEQALKKLEASNSTVYYFSSQSSSSSQDKLVPRMSRISLVIGPEGGFSHEEEAEMEKYQLHRIRLNIPIMRTPTATCVAVGYALSGES